MPEARVHRLARHHGARTLVELSPDAWRAFTWKSCKTCFGVLYADQLEVRRQLRPDGALDAVLRAAFSDQTRSPRPSARIACAPRLDAYAGSHEEGFVLDHPVEHIQAIRQRVGFVHLRGVHDADRSPCSAPTSPRPSAGHGPTTARSRGGGRSRGAKVRNRVNYLNRCVGSPTAAPGAISCLPHRGTGRCTGPPRRPRSPRWQRRTVTSRSWTPRRPAPTCLPSRSGMGGHPAQGDPCSPLGIQLDAATAEEATAGDDPGSHRGTSPGRRTPARR